MWPYRYLLDFAKPVPFLLLGSALCSWLHSSIHILIPLHIMSKEQMLIQQARGLHLCLDQLGHECWWLLPVLSGWEHTTASAQPVSPLPMLSRGEGRGAGMQLQSTLRGRWAQLELEKKKLELEVRKFSGFHFWGVRESRTQGTKILEQDLAASQKRFN